MKCTCHPLKLLILAVMLFLPTLAWGMERFATVSCAITPADSGCGWNWSDGDTLVINDNVTVTIPFGGTVIAGPDDGATTAIRNASAAGTGILVVNGTLQLKGNVTQANATWIVNADGTSSQGRIEHAGATAHYTWQIGMANNQRNAKLVLAGTGPRTGRVVVTNAAGAARFGGFHQGNTTRQSTNNLTLAAPSNGTAVLGGGNIVATWTTFQNLGFEISQNVWQDWLTASQYYDYNETSLDHCLVINCTMMRTINTSFLYGSGAVFRITNTSFLSPISLFSIYPQHLTNKSASGVRLIKDTVVEGVFVGSGFDYTFDNTVFAGKALTAGAPMLATSGRSVKINNMSDILLWNRMPDNPTGITTTSIPYGGLIERLVSIRAEGIDDDHLRLNGYPVTESSTTFDGVVLERYPGAHSNGAAFVGYTNKGAKVAISNVLDVPTIDAYGKLRPSTLSLYTIEITTQNSTMSTTLNNITRYAEDAWMFVAFESTNGNPGQITGLYNNLLWSNSAVTKQTWCGQSRAVVVDNAVTEAGYNATFSVNADGYANPALPYAVPPTAYASPPGTGDFSADPQFVDSSRNMLLWAQQFKPSITTYDEILSEILKRNDDDGYDTRFDFREYYKWVRVGFMTQNTSAFSASGKNGSYVGAVEPNFASTLFDGKCGIDNGKTLTGTPVNLCRTGASDALSGTGPWTWTCLGHNGGNPAYCSASLLTYLLTVTTSGGGVVTALPDALVWSDTTGAGSYSYGTQVTLRPNPTAAATSGTVFKGWTGACTGMGDFADGNACTVTMTADSTVTAVFGPVKVNQAPTVVLTSPGNGSTFIAPAAITMNAAAADTDGKITRVDFYNGASLLFTDTTAPYSYSWSAVPEGSYTLTAIAYDDSGAFTTSTAATVKVITAPSKTPTVTLTSPATGSTYTAPASITMTAAAADTDGIITRVDFYNGASLLFSDTTAPYSYTWSNVPVGNYTLTAIAYDDSGAFSTSNAVAVKVTTIANKPPNVTLTSPASGSTYTAPASITITVAASDTDGTISRVYFYNGTNLLFIDAAAPYSYTWTNVPTGTYNLYAIASDNLGALTTAAPITVTVTSIDSYTVSYNGNGNTGGTTPVDLSGPYLPGAKVTVLGSSSLSRAGYTFNGWNTKADGSGTAYVANNTFLMGSANVTLYAQWAVVFINTGTNYALAANGGKATASSATTVYPATKINDGIRTSATGYWRDTTSSVWPDWVQVTFNGQKTITEIDVTTVQDNLTNTVEPVPGVTTFTTNGITAYDIQFWDGTAWVTLQSITGNSQVWRRITFPAVTTNAIQVVIRGARSKYSSIVEVEAY